MHCGNENFENENFENENFENKNFENENFENENFEAVGETVKGVQGSPRESKGVQERPVWSPCGARAKEEKRKVILLVEKL